MQPDNLLFVEKKKEEEEANRLSECCVHAHNIIKGSQNFPAETLHDERTAMDPW